MTPIRNVSPYGEGMCSCSMSVMPPGPALHDSSPGPAMTLFPVEAVASNRTSSCHLPARTRVSACSGLDAELGGGEAVWPGHGAGAQIQARTVATTSEWAFMMLSANTGHGCYCPP